MCIKCIEGGFHQPSLTKQVWKNKLTGGLKDRSWVNYMGQVGHLDDNDVDVYVASDLPRKTQRYAKRLIRQINKVTEFDIIINNKKSEADVIMDDRANYDFLGEGFSGAGGVAYWENGKTYATWREEYSQPFKDRKGRDRLRGWTRHVIAHEFLHTLGLSHPFGVGHNSDYTNNDTVMSYNITQYFKNPVRPADVTALQELWG